MPPCSPAEGRDASESVATPTLLCGFRCDEPVPAVDCYTSAMATTVFTNGAVFDGHRYAGPGTVVVEDGRIRDVGGLDGLDRGARVVDLDGGLVAPGFVDAHVHAVQGG